VNRAERRAAARKMVTRAGPDGEKQSGESTRRVRSKLAEAMKSPLAEQAAVGTKPQLRQIDEDTAITESGLVVPTEGLVVP
jgi:hypothetical protein